MSKEKEHMNLHTYLNFGGNCEEAFRFYEKNLGGKIEMMMRYADQPDPKNVPPGTEKYVLYLNMTIGETQLMGSDVPPERFHPMRSVYLSLGVDSSAEAERIFKLLSEGGEVFMPMEETFFAHRFGMLRDRFGTSWMILHQKPMPA
ncbi:MAG TPA: VOC family protein [Edaphobacter sp.]|jgi:PhnB protein|nr:VOC family protein [Edaphobacter sp.]